VTTLAPTTPDALAQAVSRCLVKAPGARFQSGEEFAEALGADRRTGVPVAVRAFLRSFPRRVVAVAVGIVALVPIVVGAMDYEFGIGAGIGAALLFGVWKIGGSAFLEPGRRLLRSGHGHEDVVQAVQHDVERRREELAVQYGGEPERWVRGMSLAGTAFGALTVVLGFLPSARLGWFDWLLGLVLLVVGASGLVLSARRDLGLELAARFWSGFPGRWIFNWVGQTTELKHPAASSRTEVAIGAAAEALFGGLPRDVQRALKTLPAVVRRIEHLIHDARSRGDDLRKAELIAALETLRLDLLRLRAGSGSLESITAALAAAERIGRAADQAIASREETALRHA
jgi:hypothetical protein